MTTRTSQLGLVVALVLMAAAGAMAQQISGTITGNVADTSGAVLPGAEVTATNTATGVDSVAVVNDQGLYRIPNLPPGIYDLTASLPGFKTTVISGIEVRVDSVVRRDVALDVGAIAEQVTVEAARNVVESEEPSLGEVVGETEILELPSGEKNFMTLASITPGVTPELPTGEFGSSYANRNNLQVSISGQRHVSTNVLFDGIPSKEFYIGLVATVPAVETLQEFKVQKGYFAGNYDNAAVINVVTRFMARSGRRTRTTTPTPGASSTWAVRRPCATSTDSKWVGRFSPTGCSGMEVTRGSAAGSPGPEEEAFPMPDG